MEDLEIGVVIVNYSTWEMTIDQVIRMQKTFSESAMLHFFIVENGSKNDSLKKLKDFEEKVSGEISLHVIDAGSNLGFAKGNNIGLEYARNMGLKYAWLINNDVFFESKSVLINAVNLLRVDEHVAVVSPCVMLPNGREANRNITRPNLIDFTIGMFSYRKKGNAIQTRENAIKSYRPQGCCMICNMKAFEYINDFDPKTFLYCEELILGEKLIEKGLHSVLDTESTILHKESSSVRLSLGKIRKARISTKSFNYYLKEYREFGVISRMLACLFHFTRGLI